MIKLPLKGVMTNVTRCLSCESVSAKDERFLDLSVDIEPNSSINHCLKGFSATGKYISDVDH